ncbi:MAG: alpha/beta hydrolase fold domain-containing protein [Bacteroidaceae bacterium]|nr:alpha/beta hydrolase fold domain-containing protein [Bacteroidaceae bacterium]
MKKITSFVLMALCILAAQAQTARKFTIDLTEDGKAQMVCFLPENPSGKAIVGVPGGGYSMLSNSHEGYQASEWLNKRGIAYFVVNYRLPNGDRTIPMGDVQKGISIVRDSASTWQIHPRAVGIMGFSAGGHLASVISTHSEYEVRPDFTILFYPVISMDARVSHPSSCENFLGKEGQKDAELVRQFSTQNAVKRHLTPPAIIITASDDRLVPFVTNGLEYYKAMRNAGNECVMHVYPSGDHGFGFGSFFKYHNQLLTDLGTWLDNREIPNNEAIRVACIGNSITDGHGIDMAPQYAYPALLQKSLGKNYWVKNFGVSARTMLNKGDNPYMNEMAWRDALAFDPDIVIIKLGTNDSKPQNWQHGAEFKQNLVQMITTLSPELANLPKNKKKREQALAEATPKIYLCTPIPAFKASWNINDEVIKNEIIPLQKEVAAEYGLNLIDLHTLFAEDGDKMQTDGIHPNDRGLRRISDIIGGVLKENK